MSPVECAERAKVVEVDVYPLPPARWVAQGRSEAFQEASRAMDAAAVMLEGRPRAPC